MALFLGNLSPHVRHNELERVFRRFGRCNVQLKDGYGFVIYDDPVNAERALRAMRGKIICGEQLSLTWANKQPRPFQKFTRDDRFSEFQRQRNFARNEANIVRSRNSLDRRDFIPGKGKYRNRNFGEKGYGGDNAEQHEVVKNESSKGKFIEGGDSLEPNPLENDRWGEPFSEPLNDAMENGDEFDRYDPYHGYDGRDETEKQQITGSFGSGRDSSPGGLSRERPSFDIPKPRQSCYNCGHPGHKMRNCPNAGPQRHRFSHIHRGNDHRGRREGQFKKLMHVAWGRSDGRDRMIISRKFMNKRKDPDSWKLRRLDKRAEGFREKREKGRSLHEGGSQGKKRGRREHRSKHHDKKTRTSDCSLAHSDSGTSSHSKASSSRSVSDISSHSHSRSVSSGSRASPSSSMSASSSSYSESRSSRSRLRVTSPGPLSLSISLDQESPSANNAANEVNAAPPEDDLNKSENLLPEEGSPLVESSECKDTSIMQRVEINSEQVPADASSAFDSAMNSKEIHELQIPDPVPMKIIPFPSTTPESPAVVSSQLSNLSRVSSREIFPILKHYGLNVPEESNLELPIEDFFGAARLWPWEIIYHRRLKKGPISTENYARRLEQNREFGIIDKYIRSSSGWGECDVKTSRD